MRLVPFFTVITLTYLTPSLQALTSRGRLAWSLQAPSRLAAAVAVVPLVLVVATVHRAVWAGNSTCLLMHGDHQPDRTIAAALRAAAPSGRLATSFAWGQYSIWHFGPALRVSFDGRRETVYSDETDQRQVGIERGTPDGLAFLADVRPEYVWLAASSANTRRWVGARGDYRVDLETPDSFLGVRADQPVVRPVREVPAACFPG
jgi:hypothetical protein